MPCWRWASRRTRLQAYRTGLAISARLAKADPDNADGQRCLTLFYEDIGDALQALGDRPAALQSLRDSLEIKERLAKLDPDNLVWQGDLFRSYQKLGSLLVAMDRPLEALEYLASSLDIGERLVDESNPRRVAQHGLGAGPAGATCGCCKRRPTRQSQATAARSASRSDSSRLILRIPSGGSTSSPSNRDLALQGDEPARRSALVAASLGKLKAETALTDEQEQWLQEAQQKLAAVQ